MIWILSVGKAWTEECRNRYRDNAFTLIEMIGVLVLIGLVLGLVTPFAIGILERTQSKATLNSLVSTLHTARTHSIATKTPVVFQGDFESHRYWLGNAETQEIHHSGRLTPDVQFLEFSNGKESSKDGLFVISFFPVGNSSGGTLRLQTKSGDSNDHYLLTVNPVTGKARVHHDT